jgi:hypothetical protein
LRFICINIDCFLRIDTFLFLLLFFFIKGILGLLFNLFHQLGAIYRLSGFYLLSNEFDLVRDLVTFLL